MGLPLQDLGERVGVTRQAIHQLESSGRVPTGEMIEALAAALHVEPQFFSQTVTTDIPQRNCNFRKLESTAVREIEQVIAHGALLTELISYLEDEVDFPRPNFPHHPVADIQDVDHVAERMRLHWKLTDDQPIVSTIRVAEHAGAIVVRFLGVSSEIDALSICGARPLIIRSSSKKSPTRLRFDIAHEIGHLVLHQGGVDAGDHSVAEDQANRFASAFLLPRKAFVREFPRSGRRLDWYGIFAMKRRWNVSAAAILRRARDLGLIDAAQYRSGNIYISKQGFKRSEPFEPDTFEAPELLKSALLALERSKDVKPRDIAAALGVQPVVLGKLLGLDIPDLRDADPRVVVNFNARLNWSKANWRFNQGDGDDEKRRSRSAS